MINHLSKINIASPAKEYRLISNVRNIDSLVMHNNNIYMVLIKKDIDEGRKMYRISTSGQNLTQIASYNTGGRPMIYNNKIYFGENSFNSIQKLYSMTLDGKNYKAEANFGGRPYTIGAYKNTLYVVTSSNYQYTLKRITLK